jgi:hypothetical protein
MALPEHVTAGHAVIDLDFLGFSGVEPSFLPGFRNQVSVDPTSDAYYPPTYSPRPALFPPPFPFPSQWLIISCLFSHFLPTRWVFPPFPFYRPSPLPGQGVRAKYV